MFQKCFQNEPFKRFIFDNLTARVISPTDVQMCLRKSKGDDSLYHAAVLIILRMLRGQVMCGTSHKTILWKASSLETEVAL